MAWWNPYDWAKAATDGLSDLTKQRMRDSKYGEIDPSGKLEGSADRAGQMSEGAYGAYRSGGARIRRTEDMLRRRAMGEDSLSAEQLRQGLQQNLAAQRAQAASASPSNSAMAARTAAMQAGRLGAGLSGQQALAGIQERQQAANALGQLQLGARGQDVQMGLGAQSNQMGALGTMEQGRTARYAADMGVPSMMESVLNAGSSVAAGYAKSDINAKSDIKGADASDADVQNLLRAIKGYTYEYKNKGQDGSGRHLGVMAQDLEKSRLGKSMVKNTANGKVVDGGKLAGALAAATADMNDRLDRLELGSARGPAYNAMSAAGRAVPMGQVRGPADNAMGGMARAADPDSDRLRLALARARGR